MVLCEQAACSPSLLRPPPLLLPPPPPPARTLVCSPLPAHLLIPPRRSLHSLQDAGVGRGGHGTASQAGGWGRRLRAVMELLPCLLPLTTPYHTLQPSSTCTSATTAPACGSGPLRSCMSTLRQMTASPSASASARSVRSPGRLGLGLWGWGWGLPQVRSLLGMWPPIPQDPWPGPHCPLPGVPGTLLRFPPSSPPMTYRWPFFFSFGGRGACFHS